MRRALVVLAGVVALMWAAAPVMAHPLGNFTTNVHVGLDIEDADTQVTLVVDMAEIPTFREPLDLDGDGDIGPADLAAYSAERCAAHAERITIDADGQQVPLAPRASTASLAEGQGGLDTLRVECTYDAPLPAATTAVMIDNGVYADRTGWAELVVVGGAADGIASVSPSDVLRSYPDSAPLTQRSAVVAVGVASDVDGVDDGGTEAASITGRLGGWLEDAGSTGGLLALLAAIGLGATHALAPGHGKTLMAAYLVGRDGTPAQAAGLGMAVAVSHTIGVGVLGLITAGASAQFQPETVYPWLTTGSALIVTGLGLFLLVRGLRGRNAHSHSHDDHGHHHHDGPGGHTHEREVTDLGWRSLAALGLAGGLVPSASAVVLLLGAVAIGRPWFGVALVFGFGVGMSLALVAAGLIALRLTDVGLARIRRRIRLPARLIPTLAGLAVTLVGAFLLWDASRSLL